MLFSYKFQGHWEYPQDTILQQNCALSHYAVMLRTKKDRKHPNRWKKSQISLLSSVYIRFDVLSLHFCEFLENIVYRYFWSTMRDVKNTITQAARKMEGNNLKNAHKKKKFVYALFCKQNEEVLNIYRTDLVMGHTRFSIQNHVQWKKKSK